MPVHNPADGGKGSVGLDRAIGIFDAVEATDDFGTLDIVDWPRTEDRQRYYDGEKGLIPPSLRSAVGPDNGDIRMIAGEPGLRKAGKPAIIFPKCA